MKDEKKLIRKEYEMTLYVPLIHFKFLGIRVAFFEKKYLVNYKQARLCDILRMREDVEKAEDITEWVAKFIASHSKLTEKRLKKQLHYSGSSVKIMKFIMKTYCKGYFKEDGAKEESKKKFDLKEYAPRCSHIAFICEHTGCTFKDVMEMTWEQIEEFSKGIVWNLNEKSKDGRKTNERNAYKAMSSEDYNEEKAKKTLARINNKISKK